MLVNLDNGKVVAGRLHVAGSFWSRFAGLMGKRSLPDGEALLLFDCPSVHTCFMRFPVDVAYLDARMTVLAFFPGVEPWRIVRSVPFAAHTLELSAGTLAATLTAIGHRLQISGDSINEPRCREAGAWKIQVRPRKPSKR